MNSSRLRLMRSAARVARFHTVPTLRSQSVGEHTFGVIAILMEVYDDEVGGLLEVIQAAMRHDVPETITGDVPAPAKWMYPQLENALRGAEFDIDKKYELTNILTPKQIELIKFADLMELVIYSLEEVDMGNKHMAVMAYNALNAIKRRMLYSVSDAAYELYNEVVMSFHSKCGTSVPAVDTWHGLPLAIKGLKDE